MTWVDERAAPGRLELIRAFVNTRDEVRGPEQLERPAHVRDWLAGQALANEDLRIGAAGLARTLRLREAFRSLLLTNGGAHGAPGAHAIVNDAAARAGLLPHLAEDGTARLTATAHGLDAALGELAAVMFEAIAAGGWGRLRACPTCRWAFYDTSRNRSSRWCDMAICGNRAKQQAFNERRRLQA